VFELGGLTSAQLYRRARLAAGESCPYDSAAQAERRALFPHVRKLYVSRHGVIEHTA